MVVGACVAQAQALHEEFERHKAELNRRAASPAPVLSELDKEALNQQRRDAALVHTAYGTGLCEVVRGETATFLIQSHDASGEPLTYGGLLFKVSTVWTVAIAQWSLSTPLSCRLSVVGAYGDAIV